MVLGLRTKVFEDRLLPVPLHMVPVLDLTMADGVVDAIAWGLRVGDGLIADEEVKILDAALRRKMAGLRGECGASPTGLRGGPTRCYCGREYTGSRVSDIKGFGIWPEYTHNDGSELPANLCR